MTFEDVERALGFRLPSSARRHQAWWANTRGSHVHADAWLRSGWRTASLDLSGERVIFLRDRPPPSASSPPAALAPTTSKGGETIEVPIDALTTSALKMVREKAGEDGNLGAAVADLLRELVIARRKDLLDWFTQNASGPTSDSVELIREAREDRFGQA